MDTDYVVPLVSLNAAAAGAILLGLWLCIWGFRRQVEFRGLLCGRCGYDLRGQLARDNRCPECGTPSGDPKGKVYGVWRRSYPMIVAGLILSAVGLGRAGIIAAREIDAGSGFRPYAGMPKGGLLWFARHASADSEVWDGIEGLIVERKLYPAEFRDAFSSALACVERTPDSDCTRGVSTAVKGPGQILDWYLSDPWKKVITPEQTKRFIDRCMRMASTAAPNSEAWVYLDDLHEVLTEKQSRQVLNMALECLKRSVGTGGLGNGSSVMSVIEGNRRYLDATQVAAVARLVDDTGPTVEMEPRVITGTAIRFKVRPASSKVNCLFSSSVIMAIGSVRCDGRSLRVKDIPNKSEHSWPGSFGRQPFEGMVQMDLPPGKHVLEPAIDIGLFDRGRMEDPDYGSSPGPIQMWQDNAQAHWTVKVPVEIEVKPGEAPEVTR